MTRSFLIAGLWFAMTVPLAAQSQPVASPTLAAKAVEGDPRCVDLEIRLIELHSPVPTPTEPNPSGETPPKSGTEPKASPLPPVRTLTKEQLAGFIQSCQADPRSKILMAPRMRLPLGRKGELRSGGEVAYGVEPEATNPDTGEVTPERKLTEFFGTAVDATVTVPKPGLLRVNLMVEHSTITAQKVAPGQRPVKDARRVQTVVECQSGQTTLLRGLKSQRQTATTTRLPVLGELPVLGNAFSKTHVEQEDVELVLLVTPVLIDAAGE